MTAESLDAEQKLADAFAAGMEKAAGLAPTHYIQAVVSIAGFAVFAWLVYKFLQHVKASEERAATLTREVIVSNKESAAACHIAGKENAKETSRAIEAVERTMGEVKECIADSRATTQNAVRVIDKAMEKLGHA